MASAQVVEVFVTNKNPSQDSNHPDDLFQSRNNSKTKYNNPLLGHHHCRKKKLLYGGIHSIKLPHSSKNPFLAESKFCKRSSSVFSNYLPNETIHVLDMNEAGVAVLFAYKWLHNFVKALDEI